MSLAGILWLLEACLIIANLWNLKLFTIGEVCKTLDCTPWKLTRISEKLLVGSGWNFLLRWSRISGDIPSFLLPGCNSDRIILLTTVRRSYTRLRKFLVKHLDPLMGSFVYIYIWKKRKRGLCLNMLELSTSCSTKKNWGWSWSTPTCVESGEIMKHLTYTRISLPHHRSLKAWCGDKWTQKMVVLILYQAAKSTRIFGEGDWQPSLVVQFRCMMRAWCWTARLWFTNDKTPYV